MFELTRAVRFCVNFDDGAHRDAVSGPRHNGYAAWPTMVGLGVYYQIDVGCRGPIDPLTGYVEHLATIGNAVRKHAIPLIEQAVRSSTIVSPIALMPQLWQAIEPALDAELSRLRWVLTPYYSLTMDIDHTNRVLMTQTFDFAAAHRLHCDEFSPEENRRIFGKCNSPNGHGHNYRVEVTVAVDAPGASGQPQLSLEALEALVDDHLLRIVDHKNLNVDVEAFAELNPTVENIVCFAFQQLRDPIAATGAELQEIRIWENEKTSCSMRAPALARV